MAKADSVGTIKKRADQSQWVKTGSPGAPWKQIQDGVDSSDRPPGVASAAGGPTSIASSAPVTATAQADNPWYVHQKRYALDGHLPDATIHPNHVDIDTEGDIGAKPVLTWQDATGRKRRSYTMMFHHHRAKAHRDAINQVEGGLGTFRTAHAKLKTQMLTAATPRERDAAAVAFLHIVGGHRIRDLLGVHAQHVATAVGNAEQPGEDAGDDTVDVDVQKSATADPMHPSRVHVVLPHPKGELYTTTLFDEGLAHHFSQRVAERANEPTLHECSPEDVRGALDQAGLKGVEEHTMRHHAVLHMAADKLSKLPQPSLEEDYAGGMAQVREHVRQVSDEIGQHFGHEPAPDGMSYVPPALVAAYIEAAGGAKHWPNAFRVRPDGSTEQTKVEKSACNSPSTGNGSSPGPSPTTSGPPDRSPTSTPTTSPPSQRTPTLSPPSSSTVVLSAAGDLPSAQSQGEAPSLTRVDVKHAVADATVPVRLDDQGAPVPGAQVVVLPPRMKRDEYPFAGYINFQGLHIDVENVAGSTRSGVDKVTGKPWSIKMQAHYGEFRRTSGVDDDPLDVYVGPYADSPLVVVVHQTDPRTNKFDEDKVMLGWLSPEEAISTYRRQYDMPGFYGGCDIMSFGEFRRWLESRGKDGVRVEGAVTDVVGDRGITLDLVDVTKATPEDERLRAKLHKMLGTQYPTRSDALRKQLAERALGRAVARVRSGEMASDVLARGHQAYLSGDYRACVAILHAGVKAEAASVVKAAGAGSAGSTGSTGSAGSAGSAGSTGASSKRVRPDGAGGDGKPGPEGVPIGTITTLSDGTREQKIGPNQWRRLGEGRKAHAYKHQDTEEHAGSGDSPVLAAALSDLRRLRQRRKAATSPELRTELDQQIEAVRARISKMKRSMGKFSAGTEAKKRAQQGHAAAGTSQDPREASYAERRRMSAQTLKKSVQAATAAYYAQGGGAATAATEPWYVKRERALQRQLEELLAAAPTTDAALVNLALSAEQDVRLHAQSLANQLGSEGFRQFVAVRVGGNRGA